MSSASTGSRKGTAVRKSYEKPTLVIYGDLREITRAASTVGEMNDGGHGNNKTA